MMTAIVFSWLVAMAGNELIRATVKRNIYSHIMKDERYAGDGGRGRDGRQFHVERSDDAQKGHRDTPFAMPEGSSRILRSPAVHAGHSMVRHGVSTSGISSRLDRRQV